MLLTDAAVNNRTTVGVLVLLIVILGAYSYVTLPRESFPEVPIPVVLITTTYEGVSPEDIESSVTMKIEKEMTGLRGMKEMNSVSSEGVSTIAIEFDPGIPIENALQYVRDKLDIARAELPPAADEPSVREINTSDFPILILALSGDISPVQLKAIAEELEDAIEQVPGVLGVDLFGDLEREIRIEMDPDRVAAYGLTIPELARLIPSENVNISAGGLETEGTRFNVRVPAEFNDPEEVTRLLLTMREGRPIYLSDVATIRDTFKDRMTYSRLDGKPSLTLNVRKRAGANIIFISRAVDEILEEAAERIPAGVEFRKIMDHADFIQDTVRELENSLATALILVVAVLIFFLGLRASMIVAMAIPLSMLISVYLILALGYTLNMIVLFSLILALGMLVDNAIVIVENIYRFRQMGYNRVEAAMRGTGEVAWPVITSTATTVAAFTPLLFWPGIVGDFMKYLPITVIITLASSLFVALIITPTITTIARVTPKKPKRDNFFIRGYQKFLETALAHRPLTLWLVVALLVSLVMLYGKLGLGVEFFPDTDPDRAYVTLRLPQGTNIEETDRLARLAEMLIEPYRDEIQYVVVNSGGAGGGFSFGSQSSGPHIANLTILFLDYEDRPRPAADVVADIRRDLGEITGAEVTVYTEDAGPPTGAPVTVQISGPDFRTLERISEEARITVMDVPGLVNLRTDLEAARPEIAFQVDRRRAMMLGVTSAEIGDFLKTAIFGRRVGEYREFNEEYDITIRLPLSERQNIEDLFRLRVPNSAGDAVPLTSLGEFKYQGGFGFVTRLDQLRVVTLTADVEGRLATDALKDVQDRLEDLEVPDGYSLSYAGEQEESDEAQKFIFMQAFPIAVLVIILILVTQFNTLSVPFIIMTTVALSLTGVFAGLLIVQLPFGIIMTGLGVISLAGVVVNNGIVLLAYTRQLQSEGQEIIDAAIQAGKTRLRPVLLTAATTVLGLVPMATGISLSVHEQAIIFGSDSADWWRGMAVAVIFGLTFATVLTLVVVPTLYVSIYNVLARMGLGGIKKEPPEGYVEGEDEEDRVY